MPTTTAVPSADPSDLLFNAQKLDEVINGTAESFIDRRGVQRLTLTGALRLIGFEAPVAFAAGLSITRSTQTVTNGGNTYHADPASLPFTTTSTFVGAQWRLASNVTTFDLVNYAVPLVGGAGTIEMAKLTTAVQNLINGSLQRSGGTMTGALALPGNADDPLEAVPLQQAEAIAGAAAAAAAASAVASRMQYSLTARQTATGLAVDFNGIPSWAQRITLFCDEVSTNGNNVLQARLQTSAGYVTSGYRGNYVYFASGPNISGGLLGATFALDPYGSPNDLRIGVAVFYKVPGVNKWQMTSCAGLAQAVAGAVSSATVSLPGVLTGIRIFTNSADTFDGGALHLLIEG